MANELTKERTMTMTEIARKMTVVELSKMIGVCDVTLRKYIHEYLPCKKLIHGHSVYWTEDEIAILLKGLEMHGLGNGIGSATGFLSSFSPVSPAVANDAAAELKKEKERNQQLTSEIERLETLVSILKKEKVRVDTTDWVQWGPWKDENLRGCPRCRFSTVAKTCELENGIDFFQIRLQKGTMQSYTFVNRKCLLRILNKFGGAK